MARTDNLTNFLTDVSTAIKTKKGDNTPIKASNFDTEIANLPTGSGGVDISEYFTSERTTDTNSGVTAGHWIYFVKKLPPITALPTQCSSFFLEYKGEELDLSRVPNTIEITNASKMFNVTPVKKLDISNLNFSKATTTYSMVGSCTNLEELNLGNNTFSLTENMNQMFYCCYVLKNVPIKNFDYSSAKNLSQFLYSCREMEDDVEINAPVCTNFSNCCNGCRKITNAKFSSNAVTNINSLCTGCSELKTLDLSGMNLSGVTGASTSYSVGSFVQNCSKLENLTFGINLGEGYSSTLSANATNASLNLSTCSSLTKASVLDVFNKVADITGKNTQKITLHANVKAQLTDEEIAIATSKNWTVV